MKVVVVVVVVVVAEMCTSVTYRCCSVGQFHIFCNASASVFARLIDAACCKVALLVDKFACQEANVEMMKPINYYYYYFYIPSV